MRRQLYTLKIGYIYTPVLVLGGLIAFLIALAFRREKPVALTIAIETAVQNTSVATILLRTTLSQPWADIRLVV